MKRVSTVTMRYDVIVFPKEMNVELAVVLYDSGMSTETPV